MVSTSTEADEMISRLDNTQIDLLKEQCILVNTEDVNIGAASKKECHLMKNINEGMLHRAFSVFLFNPEGKLLLQQRADAKITFPNHWTNTCCSHPLNVPTELLEEGAEGVKNAAIRKLEHELGIKSSQVPYDGFTYLTRIQYLSENVPRDGVFGESEIDYILFAQREVDLDAINDNEVKAIKYVDPAELKQLLDNKEVLITPWFRLIAEHFLTEWWSNLSDLESQREPSRIHRM